VVSSRARHRGGSTNHLIDERGPANRSNVLSRDQTASFSRGVAGVAITYTPALGSTALKRRTAQRKFPVPMGFLPGFAVIRKGVHGTNVDDSRAVQGKRVLPMEDLVTSCRSAFR